MVAPQESPDSGGVIRTRRAHRKSRSGCLNCKLRRVKCDEGYPECRVCAAFKVRCNYDIRVSSLQPRLAISRVLGNKSQELHSVLIDTKRDDGLMRETTEENLNRLERFRLRTILSLGPPALEQLYKHEVYRLTLRHKFLVQFAETLTSIHDRYLSPAPSRRTVEEITLWNKGVKTFNDKISAPLHPSECDAVWIAASMLGVITFASIEASTPEEAWPLTSFIIGEPEWLKIGQGKFALQQLVRPDRKESIFHDLFSAVPMIELSLQDVPQEFVQLYELESYYGNGNPYLTPVSCIFASETLDYPTTAILLFYAFNSCMHEVFGDLVANKDPRALLLMAYWYSKISTGQWWLRKRALMEGRATCIYLQRYHYDNLIIQNLLREPRRYLFKSH